MKKLLLSTVAVVGFAGVASAADLPRRAVAPVAPFVPAFTWTGFYIGVNAGAAFDASSDDDDDLFGRRRGFDDDNSIRLNPRSLANSPGTRGRLSIRDGDNGLFGDDDDSDVGFSGGGQIGYNYQFTPGSGFVIGLEADIQYIDIGGDDDDNGRNGGLSYTFAPRNGRDVNRGAAFALGKALPTLRDERLSTRSLDYFGTVRGRLGYAFDRTLIYATGGFAYGGGETNDSDTDIFFDDRTNNSDDDFRYGYTVGGGVEFALSSFQLFGSSTATFKIEGLYVNLDEDDDNTRRRGIGTFNAARNTVVLNSNATRNEELEFAVIRAGINFKF